MRSDEYVILDNQLRRVGLLSNRVRAGTPFWGDTIEQSIADDDSAFAWEDLKDTFNTLNLAANKKSYDHNLTGLTIPSNAPDAQYIVPGNHLLYYDDENEHYYVMRIINIDETAKENEYQFSFDATNLAEWKLARTLPAAFDSDDVNAQTAFSNLLAKSGWRLVYNSTSTLTLKETFDGTSSAQSYLQGLAADYNVEIDCYVTLNSIGEVTDQIVEISDHLGSTDRKRIDYRQDIVGVERKLVDDALVSKLYVYGADGATIEDANNGVAFLTDPDANAKYNHDIKGAGSTWLEGTITSETIQNSSGLKAWGEKQLKMYNHPRYNYVVTMRSDIVGGIGDDMLIADFALNPPLIVKARVIKVTKSLSDPTVHSLTLGEYSSITPRVNKNDGDLTDLKEAIDQAQHKAMNAESKADQASNKATEAQVTATGAQEVAKKAQNTSDKAISKSTEAKNTATQAQQSAANASDQAVQADQKAGDAQVSADKAQTTAMDARNSADQAKDTAISANQTATDASKKADEAQTTATDTKNEVDEVRKTYFADNVFFQANQPDSTAEGAIWFQTKDSQQWLNYHQSATPDPEGETHQETITIQVPNDGVMVNTSGSFTWSGQQPINANPSMAARTQAYTYAGLSATYRGKTIADGYLWVYYTNYNGSVSYVPVKDLKSGLRFGTDSNPTSDPAAYHTETKTVTVGGNTQQVSHQETTNRVGIEYAASGKFYKTSGVTGVYTAPHQANKSYNFSATASNPIYYESKIYSDQWLWVVLNSGNTKMYAPAYTWNGSDDLSGVVALGIDTNQASNLPAREIKTVTETVNVPDTSADNDTQISLTLEDVEKVFEYQAGQWTEIPFQKQVIGASLMGASIDSPLISLGEDGALWSSYSYAQLSNWFKPIEAQGTVAMAKGELIVTGQTRHYENSDWGYYDTDQTFKAGTDTNYTTTIINAGGIKNEIQSSDREKLVARTFMDGNGFITTTGERGNIQNQISNQAFTSQTIYNSTTSDGANVNISPNGVLKRSTSATKYKLNISPLTDDLVKGYNLIRKVHPKQWFDRSQVENYAKSLTDNTPSNPDDRLLPVPGLIAEELVQAGLTDFVTYGKGGEVEGIDYAKLWTLLMPVCADLDQRLTDMESKLKDKGGHEHD
ncbi:phage tail spike protein [uncultured Secundilactobacillus sp.]|uniref:phage tail spike protein n=1 Tax=uncultured Secundilactobacillus sp. TaxID=2813935 RepID=UPI00258A36E7|nr:phage tail spike protein [uncultured Secundilactobacillus sp.]